jgi:hypothetical protein
MLPKYQYCILLTFHSVGRNRGTSRRSLSHGPRRASLYGGAHLGLPQRLSGDYQMQDSAYFCSTHFDFMKNILENKINWLSRRNFFSALFGCPATRRRI